MLQFLFKENILPSEIKPQVFEIQRRNLANHWWILICRIMTLIFWPWVVLVFYLDIFFFMLCIYLLNQNNHVNCTRTDRQILKSQTKYFSSPSLHFVFVMWAVLLALKAVIVCCFCSSIFKVCSFVSPHVLHAICEQRCHSILIST